MKTFMMTCGNEPALQFSVQECETEENVQRDDKVSTHQSPKEQLGKPFGSWDDALTNNRLIGRR